MEINDKSAQFDIMAEEDIKLEKGSYREHKFYCQLIIEKDRYN